jgi:hypothetical protein
MRSKLVAGVGLLTLMIAPMALADPQSKGGADIPAPAYGRFDKGVSFQGKGDVRQGAIHQKGEVRQGDIRQKGDIRQSDVRQSDVRQMAPKADVHQRDVKQR